MSLTIASVDSTVSSASSARAFVVAIVMPQPSARATSDIDFVHGVIRGSPAVPIVRRAVEFNVGQTSATSRGGRFLSGLRTSAPLWSSWRFFPLVRCVFGARIFWIFSRSADEHGGAWRGHSVALGFVRGVVAGSGVSDDGASDASEQLASFVDAPDVGGSFNREEICVGSDSRQFCGWTACFYSCFRFIFNSSVGRKSKIALFRTGNHL